MSKTNIKIILFLLALIMVGGTYFYVFKGNMDDKESLESETESLEATLADLRQKDADRAFYIEETEKYLAEVDEKLLNYPATLDQEVSVMFVKGAIMKLNGGSMDDTSNFDINSVGLGVPEPFYTLGTGYECYKASFPVAYQGSYEGIKEFVRYIMGYKYRMNIDTISIAYDAAEDKCTGAFTMNAYCVYGEGREADTINVDVPNGVDNIFLGGEGAPNSTASSHDEDNGASIATDNDIKIILNNANNDSTDGIIVSAGSGTMVTSSENKVENVKIEIFAEDEKNYATYSVGDKGMYTVEITGTEVKIFVDSSDRVDSNDKNGVKVSVSNDTNLPVFFKVDGDDATSPRFVLGGKSGTVKVY